MKDTDAITKAELKQAILAHYIEDKDNPDGFLAAGEPMPDLKALEAASADLADVYISAIMRMRSASRVLN